MLVTSAILRAPGSMHCGIHGGTFYVLAIFFLVMVIMMMVMFVLALHFGWSANAIFASHNV